MHDGAAAVRAAVESAEADVPGSAEQTDDERIAELAKLDPIAYDRARAEAAKEMGIRVGLLDRLVRAALGGGTEGQTGHSLVPPAPEPWPEPVNGAALLTDLAATLRRYVNLPANRYCDVVALWVLHTHTVAAFPITPRLAIVSPEKRSGKSTLLDLLECLVARPLAASNITPAAMFRTIEAARPTLLVDEFDSFAKDNNELRNIVNAGHKANGHVIRSTPVGDEWEPRRFATFSPVALASIGPLPDTITDRSIVIPTRRKTSKERIERLRVDRPAEFAPLARRCARWAADNTVPLAAADPELPPALFNRAADNWRSLVAIADAAGGDWPERARAAALTELGAADDSSWGTMLLADIRAVFQRRGDDRILSKTLADDLIEQEDRPWPEWRRGMPITPRQIAEVLAPFGIAPKTIRLGPGPKGTAKGYLAAQFADAWERYLDLPPPDPSQRHTPQNPLDSDTLRAVTPRADVTEGVAPEPADVVACDAVTAQSAEALSDIPAFLDRRGR